MKLPNIELVTLKDIANQIAFKDIESDFDKSMRQVRHWTQTDLLRTTSEKETGKGIPRFYEEEPTVMIAAILKELSLYGATIELLRSVADELYGHWENDGGMYLASALMDINSYLQVIWNLDKKTGKFTDASIYLFDDMDKKEGGFLNEHPTSSVLINMSMIASRLYSEGEQQMDNQANCEQLVD